MNRMKIIVFEKRELYFEIWIWISRISFLGLYLKEEGDYNYIWIIENSPIHFPYFFILVRGITNTIIYLKHVIDCLTFCRDN